MAKKKKLSKAERREIRLQKARQWVSTYEGGNIAKAYSKQFSVDINCALNDLRAVGALQPEKPIEVKHGEDAGLQEVHDESEQRSEKSTASFYSNSDDKYFFIAGRTAGGMPYGVTWEEMGMKPYEPFGAFLTRMGKERKGKHPIV